MVAGGIATAAWGLVLSPAVDERERVKNTTPYLQDAYSDKLIAARRGYSDQSYIHIEDKILMCGSKPGCKGQYSVQQLMQAERKVSSSLQSLAHYYGVLSRCIGSKVCSARTAYHFLCEDATEKYKGIVAIREHVLERLGLEGMNEDDLKNKGKEMERGARVIYGLRAFSEGCLEWNRKNPRDKAPVVEKPFITYL